MNKAIETSYKGCRFRSRLEARWAVFFDEIGATWEYEPEGFVLSDGTKYLPDFFVRMNDMLSSHSGSGYWVEVKGTYPTHEEIKKMEMLVDGGMHHGYLAYGYPGANNMIPVWKNSSRKVSEEESAAMEILEGLSGFKKARKNMEDPVFNLLWSAVVTCCSETIGMSAIKKAVDVARSARFEFGESGARGAR